ncbi:MAG TPA: BofC C-terminal domain-containing protein [Capillibacterium sp.]
MKRVVPVLFLILLGTGAGFLARTGKLSPVLTRVINREEITAEFVTLYTQCQHEEKLTRTYPHQNWAATLEELFRDGWLITSFAAERVALQKKADDLCRTCREEEFIGIYGREIGVYAGSPEQPGPLKQIIPVDIGQLPPAEIADLRAGIICDQPQDKWRILEGYQN